MSFAIKKSGSGLPPLGAGLILQSLQHAIVDDDVDVAPTYRCGGTVDEPEDPTRIMICVLNERLQGWRVIVSNLLWKKEFL